MEQRRQEAKALFSLIDANQDGSVDLDELSLNLADSGLTQDQIETLLWKLDGNHDSKVTARCFRVTRCDLTRADQP